MNHFLDALGLIKGYFENLEVQRKLMKMADTKQPKDKE